MKITLDPKYADSIKQKIVEAHHLGQRVPTNGKWHVSDTLFPPYAYFCRIYGHEPSDEEIGFYVTGEAYHLFLQKILGEDAAEVQGEYLNIIGTCDWLDKDVTEIKTSRKWTVPKMPEEHYVEQAGKYCVIFRKKRARILAVYPVAGRKWNRSQASTVEIVAWTVTFTSKDLKEIEDGLHRQSRELNWALKHKDFHKLPLCPAWKCGRVWNKELKLCPFYHKCKPTSRYPEEKLLKKINKKKSRR